MSFSPCTLTLSLHLSLPSSLSLSSCFPPLVYTSLFIISLSTNEHSGFISAEALTEILPGEVGKSDAIHKYVVYSSWASLDHWNEWARDQKRNQTAISMEKHLVSPAVHRIFRVANDKRDLPLL